MIKSWLYVICCVKWSNCIKPLTTACTDVLLSFASTFFVKGFQQRGGEKENLLWLIDFEAANLNGWITSNISFKMGFKHENLSCLLVQKKLR